MLCPGEMFSRERTGVTSRAGALWGCCCVCVRRQYGSRQRSDWTGTGDPSIMGESELVESANARTWVGHYRPREQAGATTRPEFHYTAKRTEYGGCNMISSVERRGHLRAANQNRTVGYRVCLPILGTRVVSFVFPAVDERFGAQVTVVKGMLFGLILGVAFMRQYHRFLLYEGS